MKRHFIKCIVCLKWLFVLLLFVLLCVGIYFHAPWKVLALIVIFLAAHTILAKRFRKKFWAVVGIVVFGLIVWVFLPEDNSDWKPYTFGIDEDIVAMNAKRTIPDEQNAAVIYNKLFIDYGKFNDVLSDNDSADPNMPEALKALIKTIGDKIAEGTPKTGIYPDFWNEELDTITMTRPWSSEDYPELAEWLDSLKEPFELLKQASEIEQCVFPIEEFDFLDKTGRRPVFKRWSQMMVRAANNHLGDNDIDSTLDKISILMKMARHQYQQPSRIDLLFGIAFEGLASSRLSPIIVNHELSDRQIEQIDNLLTLIQHDWPLDFAKLYPYEILSAKKEICKTVYEVNSRGKTRFARDGMAPVREMFGDMYMTPSYMYRRGCKIGAILNWFWIPSSPDTAVEIFDKVNEKRLVEVKPNFNRSKEETERILLNFRYLVKAMIDVSVGPDNKTSELYLRVASHQQVGRLIVGLRRYKDAHGQWPGQLVQIKGLVDDGLFVDPVNGSDYGYELTDDGFAIYTKGENGIDEGGVIGRKKEDGSKTDDFTFWPGKRSKSFGK
jgi:hypothetical protein